MVQRKIGPRRMKPAIEALSSKEIGSYKVSSVFIIAFHLTAATKCSFWIKLSWPPENILLLRN
jgi:hypothetical protein